MDRLINFGLLKTMISSKYMHNLIFVCPRSESTTHSITILSRQKFIGLAIIIYEKIIHFTADLFVGIFSTLT